MSTLTKLLPAAVLAFSAAANASPIVSGFNQAFVPAVDDGSTRVNFTNGMKLRLNGTVYSGLYINTNGNVSFDTGMTNYSPAAFNGDSYATSFLAPFFGDVDISNGGGTIGYGNGKFEGHNAFGVTWSNVGYFPRKNDLKNTFQLLLVDRSDTGANNFDFYFNYGSIQWDSASVKSRAGFHLKGKPADFEFEGSGTATKLLDSGTHALVNASNVSMDGRYAFNVRKGAITFAEPVSSPAEVPLPGTLPLLGIGAIALAYGRRRKS